MTYAEFNRICRMLPATTYVVQWGGSHVWKVGGKVFAVGGLGAEGTCFTFKVSDLAYEMLKELPGLRPAPYLASRGLKWIQHFAKPGLSDSELRSYIRQSYRMTAKAVRVVLIHSALDLFRISIELQPVDCRVPRDKLKGHTAFGHLSFEVGDMSHPGTGIPDPEGRLFALLLRSIVSGQRAANGFIHHDQTIVCERRVIHSGQS